MRHTNTLTFNTGKIQTVEMDQLAPLSPTLIKYVQNFMGTLLYYSRKVDPTLAAALSAIAARQAKGTEYILTACHQLLDYSAIHLYLAIVFLTSDMILEVHYDASYLLEKETKSREGGHFYLTNKNDEQFKNGSIRDLSSIFKSVMASASEADLDALVYNCKQAVPLRFILDV